MCLAQEMRVWIKITCKIGFISKPQRYGKIRSTVPLPNDLHNLYYSVIDYKERRTKEFFFTTAIELEYF